MAEDTHHTRSDDPADHGHHGHHILSPRLLLTVFGALVVLTVITVVLALAERADVVYFGGDAGSVAVALFIAGIKATLVAAFFMALKYDNKVNLLAFLMSIIFLGVFFVITYLDYGFRGQFEYGASAQPIDQILLEQQEAERLSEQIQPRFEAQPVVGAGDTTLVGPPPTAQ